MAKNRLGGNGGQKAGQAADRRASSRQGAATGPVEKVWLEQGSDVKGWAEAVLPDQKETHPPKTE